MPNRPYREREREHWLAAQRRGPLFSYDGDSNSHIHAPLLAELYPLFFFF